MDITKDFYKLKYRRDQLERELDKIREAVSGREVSFLSRITDKDGKRNPEKVEELINAMIESYNKYLKVQNTVRDSESNFIEGDSRKLFHHFLYLAILGPGAESCIDDGYFFIAKSEKYSDILKNAEKLEFYKNRVELYHCEQQFSEYSYEGGASWTDYLNYVFARISGRPISDTYTLSPEEWDPNNLWGLWNPPVEEDSSEMSGSEEVKTDVEDSSKTLEAKTEEKAEEQLFELLPGLTIRARVLSEEEAAEYLASEKYAEEYEKYKAENGLDIDDLDQAPPMTQEEYDRWEEEMNERMAEEYDISEKSYQYWHDTLPDEQAFCRIYLEFRELMLRPELASYVKNMEKEMEMLLDAWLYQTGESPFALGESYSLVSARLQNTTAHLMRELDRARRLK